MKPLLRDQLPGHLAADPFLAAFIGIFDEVHATVRGHAASMEYLTDPAVTPPDMVRWLGRWLDVLVEPSLPEARQRELVARAADFLPLRSTRAGLEGLLAAMTGGLVEIEDRCGVYAAGTPTVNPKHVEITMETAGEYSVAHLRNVIESELPGDVTYELWVAGEQVEITDYLHGSDYPIGLGIIEVEPHEQTRPAGTSRRRFEGRRRN